MIVWIASYPKSGNTWVRAILSSLLYTEDGNFSIQHLKKIDQYPIRKYFEGFVNNYHDIKEVMRYWIVTQDKLNLDNKTKFLKTHHALCKVDNFHFTNNDNTLATIYIVRDPRNVITSISNYFNFNYDKAKKFMFSSSQGIIGTEKNNKNSISTLIGSWSDHYSTWTKNNKNLLIVKYENLILNTEGEITKIINFLKKYKKIKINDKKIKNCIKTTSFENLKKMEEIGHFNEIDQINNKEKKTKFFNLGKENKWENLLDNKIKIDIEEKFLKEMKELKYI
ncbi:MAG: sulfotransferase domain-containing protein [Pelagibacterales bacterium]|nr:sulfotransferase domain-containing protein [Pelagibacterales bacterium]